MPVTHHQLRRDFQHNRLTMPRSDFSSRSRSTPCPPIKTIQQLANPGPAIIIEDQSDHPGIMPQDQTQRATQTILKFAHFSALINSNFSFRLNDLIRNSTLLASERLPISC